MASKDLKECSTSLTTEEICVKTIRRFLLSSVSMPVVTKRKRCQCRYGEEAGTVNWYRHIEIGMEVFQNLKVDLLFDPALLLQESMSKSAYHGDTCTSMQYSQ